MVLNELGASLTCALRKLTSDGNKIDKNHIDEIVKEICGALLRNDVNILQVKQLKESLAKNIVLDSIPPGANKRKIVQGAILNSLIQLVDPGVPCWSPSKSTVNVVMLVGLQGAGKTTTCTKLAHYYKTRGYRVGLVCTDTFRAGAFDQLKQNATRAGIPYYGYIYLTKVLILNQIPFN